MDTQVKKQLKRDVKLVATVVNQRGKVAQKSGETLVFSVKTAQKQIPLQISVDNDYRVTVYAGDFDVLLLEKGSKL